MPIAFDWVDLLTVGLLVLLEGLLSADNALVLAILVMGLPRHQQGRALRYGIAGAFVFRAAAVVLAVQLIQAGWVRLAGGAYLLYLVYEHFRGRSGPDRRRPRAASPAFGLSAFWATVVRVEVVDVAFSIDSILVAVALSPKLWVVITGGVLGIVMMRLVAGRFIALLRRYPTLVDGAFVVVAWVGLKLVVEFAHWMNWIAWEIPRSVAVGLVVVIFVGAYVRARRQGSLADVIRGDRD